MEMISNKMLVMFFCLCLGKMLQAQEPWVVENEGVYYSEENVGIGTLAQENYKLAVDGRVHAREVHINQNSWPDYVFRNDYQLPSLDSLRNQIKNKGHLINIPSAEEVGQKGIKLAEMNRLLMEKVEELTLYLLAHREKRKTIEARIHTLMEQFESTQK